VRASEWSPAFSEDKESTLLQGCVRMPTYEGCLVLLWANRPLKHRSAEDELLEELDTNRFDSYRRERWPAKWRGHAPHERERRRPPVSYIPSCSHPVLSLTDCKHDVYTPPCIV
jgi:hypothetical protein